MESFYLFDSFYATALIFAFVVAMAMACTADRHYNESPKWLVSMAGVAVLLFINREAIFAAPIEFWRHLPNNFWLHAAVYLAIGLGYSIIEFWMDVRRSATHWAKVWNEFKKSPPQDGADKNSGRHHAEKEPMTQDKLVQLFLEERSGAKSQHGYSERIVVPKATPDGTAIEPTIDRMNLAQSIGCWTIWWPFYAISLIVGDLFSKVFEAIASVVANISDRFVKNTFKDVFKA